MTPPTERRPTARSGGSPDPPLLAHLRRHVRRPRPDRRVPPAQGGTRPIDWAIAAPDRRRRLRRRPPSARRPGARGRPARRGRELRPDPPGPVPVDLARCDRRGDRRGAGRRDRRRSRRHRPPQARRARPRGDARQRPDRRLDLVDALPDRRSRGPARRVEPPAASPSPSRSRSTATAVADRRSRRLAAAGGAARRAVRASRASRMRRAAAAPRRRRRRPSPIARRSRAGRRRDPTRSLVAERIAARRAGRVFGLRHTLVAPLTTDGGQIGALLISRRTAGGWPPARPARSSSARRSRPRPPCRGPTRTARRGARLDRRPDRPPEPALLRRVLRAARPPPPGRGHASAS